MADFPSGIILLWYGSIASIPTGWTLCDGTLGTPDLRDRFITGAGATFAVGALGGSLTHTHTFTSNLHTHTIPAGTDIASGVNFADVTTNVAATGTTDLTNTLPPYHALAWIMKL